MTETVRIAMISEHASPPWEARVLSGQSVYVAELSSALAEEGYQVDVFTRKAGEAAAEVCCWQKGVRVMHLEAGPAFIVRKDLLWS